MLEISVDANSISNGQAKSCIFTLYVVLFHSDGLALKSERIKLKNTWAL